MGGRVGRWILAGGFACWAGVLRADCPTAGAQVATIAAVGPRLELHLADGRLVRLAGLDPVQPTPTNPDRAEAARRHLADGLVGQPVSIQVLSAAPDRWGRLPALVFQTTSAGGLAATEIAAGFGRYLAEPAANPCREALLSSEAQARQAKLGLWADPYYAVLAVDDPAAFTEHSGTIVVTEGRLVAVEPGPYRTKLRFVALRSRARHVLAATILPHVMKAFEAKGVMFPSLIGHSLRLRGLLDLRFGPQIELAGPDDVEIVDMPAH